MKTLLAISLLRYGSPSEQTLVESPSLLIVVMSPTLDCSGIVQNQEEISLTQDKSGSE